MPSDAELEVKTSSEVIDDITMSVKAKKSEFSDRKLGLLELTELLERGTVVEKMAAARLIGEARDGAAVVALVDALEVNRKNPMLALQIVTILKGIHTTEVVSGFFHRLFDDTDDAMVKPECRLAIGERGGRALERIEIEPHTTQFRKLMEDHSISEGQVKNEIAAIKGIMENRRMKEEVKHMMNQMSHQHAIHSRNKGNPHQKQHQKKDNRHRR